MKFEDFFKHENAKPFVVYYETEEETERGNVFTGIEVDNQNGLGQAIQVRELYISEGIQYYSEFDARIIIENLSRLSEKYLAWTKEYCEKMLAQEYSNYLNNWQEYDFWVETLEKINVEIKERSEK